MTGFDRPSRIIRLAEIPIVFLAALAGGVVPPGDGAAADAAPLTFTNFTTANGLGGNYVYKVFVSGSTIYAALPGNGLNISTNGGTSFTNLLSSDVLGVYASGSSVYAATSSGLAISTNGGTSFSFRTTGNGLGSDVVSSVYASGSTIYAGTQEGLSTSTNGAASFSNNFITGNPYDSYVLGVYASGSNVYVAFLGPGLYISRNGGLSYASYATANGLGSNDVSDVLADGNTVYAATAGGLSISTNGGFNYTNYTTANGLGGNSIEDVYAIGTTVYAATDGGLSISTNGGTSFTNYTTANGLGSNLVFGVYAFRNTVYAATLEGLGIAVAPLVWNTTTGTWNGTLTAWTSAVGNTLTFVNGDAVIFSDARGGTVTLSGSLQPSSITVSATSGTYAFVSSAGNLLTGTTGLAKSGAGTLVLSGSNSFTGATSVSGGKLLVNGILSSTSTTLATAAVLGGSGTISGAVVVGASGTLSPGNSPGIITVGSLSLSGSAFTLMEIVGSGSTAGVAGTAYDQVAVTGATGLSFGGTLDLDFGGRTTLFEQGTMFQLFSFSGTTSGDFTTIRTIDSSGSYANLAFSPSPFVAGEWTTGIIAGSGNQYLVFSENTGRLVALPEPSAVAMAALGAGLGGWQMWRGSRLRKRGA